MPNREQLKLIVLFSIITIAPSGGNGVLASLQIIIYLMTFYIRPSKLIMQSVYILALPIAIGLFLGMLKYNYYNVFKDSYYFLNPIVYLLAGAMISKHFLLRNILLAISIIGSIFSFYLIVFIITHSGTAAIQDPRTIRESLSVEGYIITVMVILILLCCKLYKIQLFKRKSTENSLLFLNLLSLYLSASRTNIIVLLVTLFIMFYVKYRQKRSIFFIYSFFFLLLSITYIIFNSKSEFVNVILRSPEEISIQPAQNAKEINENYRGHEAYMTMRLFKRSHLEEKIIGHGFGATVDMGIEGPLELRHIPIMHNGYPYILLKTGWIGLFAYIWGGYLLIRLSLSRKHGNNQEKSLYGSVIGLFTVAIIPAIYIINTSVTAIFNPQYVILWVMCGISLQYKLDCNRRLNNNLFINAKPNF